MAVKEGGLPVKEDPCRLGRVFPPACICASRGLALARWVLSREGGTGSPAGAHGPAFGCPLCCHSRCFRGLSTARSLGPQERVPIHAGETYLWPERGGCRRYYIYQHRASVYTD